MYSGLDVLAVIGVLAVVAVAVFAKIRFKAKQIIADLQSIDLVAGEQDLIDAQQQSYEKVVADQKAETVRYRISGNCGLPFSSVFLMGAAINATVADVAGDFVFEDLTPGNYLVTPHAAGHVFKPDFRALRIVDADATGVDFEDPSSVVDSRQAVLGSGPGPNGSRTLNGSLIYDVQTSSNSNIPPTDCRVNKPVGCSSLPQNSRK
jgi:hypothetical protein